MCSTYNFYELCGKTGATQKTILAELQGLGIEITRSQLRERLARAVALGYMIRKTRGHVFLWKICDRHVLSLLATSPENEENILEKLMDDIEKDGSDGENNQNMMTMTEEIDVAPECTANKTELKEENGDKIVEENNKEEETEGEDCFLKECWQQVGSFIEGLDKSSPKNRNCDSNYSAQNSVHPSSSKLSSTKTNEIISKAGPSRRSSEMNNYGDNVKVKVEDILESENNLEGNEVNCIAGNNNVLNKKLANKLTEQLHQEGGTKLILNNRKENLEDNNNSKKNLKENSADSDSRKN